MYAKAKDNVEPTAQASTAKHQANVAAVKNQITIKTSATTGSLLISVRPNGTDDFEPLLRQDGSTQVVITIAGTERTVLVDGPSLAEVKAVPTSLDAEYTLVVVSSVE